MAESVHFAANSNSFRLGPRLSVCDLASFVDGCNSDPKLLCDLRVFSPSTVGSCAVLAGEHFRSISGAVRDGVPSLRFIDNRARTFTLNIDVSSKSAYDE
jgi:hypothetical protein